jgi:N6-adenosine-specific RNA methylase IME4/ParB-like chromosome segregation protein Spo0J
MTKSLTQTAAPGGEIADIKAHPLADLFPLMDGSEYQALVEDIRVRGLISPIIMLDGMILDGRNRYRACIDAGVPVQTENFTGDDPLGWVISSNLHRRHLNESQRAMIAAKLANMRQGERTDLAQICAKSQDRAAELLNISRRTVQHAAVVRDHAVPELAQKVERGELAVSVAAEAARLPPEEQRKIATLSEGGIRSTVRIRAKQAERSKREKLLGQATKKASVLLGEKRYGVIYSDPPWRFEPYSRETGMDRAADNHYPTMTIEEIAELRIPAADDCVLFLWATAPMLPQALEIMRAWGFEYRSQIVWVKDKAGTGYWARNKHELLLIGTKGRVPAPAPGEQFESAIQAPVGAHSEKPALFAEIIQKIFPTLPRLEMFARGRRRGWDVWGNEAPCSPETETEAAT